MKPLIIITFITLATIQLLAGIQKHYQPVDKLRASYQVNHVEVER